MRFQLTLKVMLLHIVMGPQKVSKDAFTCSIA